MRSWKFQGDDRAYHRDDDRPDDAIDHLHDAVVACLHEFLIILEFLAGNVVLPEPAHVGSDVGDALLVASVRVFARLQAQALHGFKVFVFPRRGALRRHVSRHRALGLHAFCVVYCICPCGAARFLLASLVLGVEASIAHAALRLPSVSVPSTFS